MKKQLAFSAILSLCFFVLAQLQFATAQSGCVGDPCIFETPTPGNTPTATPVPGTGTPTAVAVPDAVEFPQPNYSVPTSIPTIDFPALPTALQVTLPAPTPLANLTPTPLPLPSVITSSFFISAPAAISLTALAGPVTGTASVDLTAISTTLLISYTPFVTLSGETTLTGTTLITTVGDLIGVAGTTAQDLISYTNSISQSYADLQSTEAITVLTAPADYVPDLPRPMANVGWTFEQMDTNDSFSLRSWAGFVGYVASLPISIIKAYVEFASNLGPFSLFLTWLLIMFGIWATINALRLLYHIIITIVDVVIKIIDLIGQYLPTGG
jgi:hypothetical protein